ncbi:MAG: phosphoheptose isomerase [Patescibacteria group bacterium]|nr:phosphoheptose isomerase [Patescibacteria group bacterium]
MTTIPLHVLDNQRSKHEVIQDITAFIDRLGFRVREAESDFHRPWGAFWRIDESESQKFLQMFFPDIQIGDQLSVSPKFLLVEPEKRLSWQWHERRREEWYVVGGPIAVMRSNTDAMPVSPDIHQTGQRISLGQGERHRLIGLHSYGLVAEIWVHTDPSHPSDEADNHRVQDDFQRV